MTAQTLAQSASEQAAGIEETSASIEQMTASIAQNSDNAKVTDNIASKASTEAVHWRGFDLTGVRLDLVQAVQVARAHGALVAD